MKCMNQRSSLEADMRTHHRLVFALLLGGGLAGCASVADPRASTTAIAIVEGDGQEAVTPRSSQGIIGDGALPESLAVRVTTAAGAPLSGVSVLWTSSGGNVTASSPLTDATGVVRALWTWYAPQTGWAPAGRYTARASVSGSDGALFTGYARAGPSVTAITMTPGTVSVAGGDASVAVAVHVVDDRRADTVKSVGVQFYNPTATTTVFKSVAASLTLVSGTASDGVWSGTIVMPQGSEVGAWTLGRLTIGWGCGPTARTSLFDTELKTLSLPYQLIVENR